ncbi:Putative inorganic phosphate cotransporter [Frankliniella fusca]|uniref:Inorganic phosphate cotransporter n=1 Tax=Frankliniella fusca TaxID=407009 RepID=A0AAE1I3D8_9NEOP|nr:Putative inorganic phosphate cotransporter [Frankliniella fusca]
MVHRTPIEWQGVLPARYVFVLMGGLAIFCAYTMRSAMSVAITEMASAPSSHSISRDSCVPEAVINGNSSAITKETEFDWDEETQGQVLSALFWGYVAGNVPNGLLADRFGGKRVLFCGILLCSLSTLVIPLAARHGGPVAVIVARILEGAGESGAYPGNNNLLAYWGPAQERSLMGSVVFAGNLLGQVVGTAASGVIITATGDWASAFYVFGGIGVAWCVLFWFLCYDTPADHPRISEAERNYIETAIKANATRRPTCIPWLSILCSLPVWALIVGQLGHDWALFTIGTELPKYMKSVLGYEVSQNGLISAIPNLATWICACLSGFLSDWLIRSGRISIPVHRKSFTTFACFTPGVGLLAATYAGCDRTVVVALFCVGMALMGPFYSSLKVNALDISPNYSGLVMSIVNGLGAVSGIVSPSIVGLIITDRTLTEWRNVFWVTFGVCLASSLFYWFFSSAQVQAWNNMGEGGEYLEEVRSAASTPSKEQKQAPGEEEQCGPAASAPAKV